MPGRDGTGPIGMGQMTGRGLGNCISYGIPVLAGAIAGFCFGGRRRGFRNMFNNTGLTGWQRNMPSEDEITNLKNQANVLETSLNDIRDRIYKLENK